MTNEAIIGGCHLPNHIKIAQFTNIFSAMDILHIQIIPSTEQKTHVPLNQPGYVKN